MVSRRVLLGSALAMAMAACRPDVDSRQQALLLRGFQVVDPSTRQVSRRDLLVQDGVVVARAQGPVRTIEGHGRFLMPALWDLQSALWGNNSTKSYDVLAQDMSFTKALGVHLYYGVGHVGVFGARFKWMERSLERADALELDAAELLFPDVALCGKRAYGCDEVKDRRAVKDAFATRQREKAPFVVVTAGRYDPEEHELGVSHEVLAAALAGARQRRLPALVAVETWAQAAAAVELGASVVYGLPEGLVPAPLVEHLRDAHVAYAPALGLYLELDHLLENERALRDPFLTATVQPIILDSYRSEKGLFDVWRYYLDRGRARRQSALESVKRLAEAGVPLVVTADACWAGTFQGHASHVAQRWLERAGIDGWTRLAAATVNPARLLGRRVDFAAGAPADFLVLEQDPLESAANLQRISLVLRRGKVVDRAKLLPDLTRRDYYSE